MPNIEYRRMTPGQQQQLEADLLPCNRWKEFKDKMPPECADVVTGEAFYCGLEGIGFKEETGWYLILWEPDDDNPPETVGTPIGNTGLTLLKCDIPNPKKDKGHVTLLFMQRPSAFIESTPPAAAPVSGSPPTSSDAPAPGSPPAKNPTEPR